MVITPLPFGEGSGVRLLVVRLFLLRSFEVNGALASLLGLESCSLSSTARYEVEYCVVDEVFEFSVGGEDDVDILDVVGGERLQRLGTLRVEGDTEGTETFELNLVCRSRVARGGSWRCRPKRP